MSEKSHSDGSITYHRDGRWVRAWPLIQSYWHDQPCYFVRLVGDVDMYFGADTTILHRLDRGDITYVWYQTDAYFVKYANDLMRLGGWATSEDDNALVEKVLNEQS